MYIAKKKYVEVFLHLRYHVKTILKLFCPSLDYSLCSEPKTMALNITQGTTLRSKSVRLKPGKGIHLF